MKNAVNTRRLGTNAEEQALIFLKQQGLVLLEQNYTTRRGEIDLIMQDQATIVFIEVRSRSDNSYLEVIETIDKRKIDKIISASQHYLQSNYPEISSFRFDIVTLTGNLSHPDIDWIKDAFDT